MSQHAEKLRAEMRMEELPHENGITKKMHDVHEVHVWHPPTNFWQDIDHYLKKYPLYKDGDCTIRSAVV